MIMNVLWGEILIADVHVKNIKDIPNLAQSSEYLVNPDFMVIFATVA